MKSQGGTDAILDTLMLPQDVSGTTEFLAASYPRLRAYLGASRFKDMVRELMKSRAAGSRDIAWYEANLPACLTASATLAQIPAASELATLERELQLALLAPEAAVVGPSDVAAIGLERLPKLAVTFNPSVRLQRFRFNTAGIWSALVASETPCCIYKLEQGQHVVIWRQNDRTRFRLLGAEEASVLAALLPKANVADEVTAPPATSTDIAELLPVFLPEWVESRMISSIGG